MSLDTVLAAIAAAQNEQQLEAIIDQAKRLTPAERDVARWSYAYAREQNSGRVPFHALPRKPVLTEDGRPIEPPRKPRF